MPSPKTPIDLKALHLKALSAELDNLVHKKKVLTPPEAAKLLAPVQAFGTAFSAIYGNLAGKIAMSSKDRETLADIVDRTLVSIKKRYSETAPRRRRPKVEIPAELPSSPRQPIEERAKTAKYNSDLAAFITKAATYYDAEELASHAGRVAGMIPLAIGWARSKVKGKSFAQDFRAEICHLDKVEIAKAARSDAPADLRHFLGDSRRLVLSRMKGYAERHTIRPSDWVLENVVLSEGYTAPTKMRKVQYQADLIDLLCSGDSNPQEVFFPKSSRVGWTTILLACLLYNNYVRRLSQVLYLPTGEMVKRWQKSTLDPAVAHSPLADIEEKEMAERRVGNKRVGRLSQDNTGATKYFDGVPMQMLPTRSAVNLTAFTASIIMVDESDSAYAVGTENVNFFEEAKRAIRGAPGARALAGGTPSERGNSFLVERANASAHYFHWRIPCPHCKEPITLDWNQRAQSLGGTHGFKWGKRTKEKGTENDADFERRAQSVRYIPMCCGNEFHYRDFIKVTDDGFWGTDDGVKLDCSQKLPKLYDRDGKNVRMPASVGLHIWAAYSVKFPWEQIVFAFLRANTADKLATFVRTYLGQQFLSPNLDVEADEAAGRISFPHVPSFVEIITAGGDVQKDKLVIGVFGYGGARTQMCLIDHRVFLGTDTANPRDVAWKEAAEWLDSRPTYATKTGKELRIHSFWCDVRYQMRNVKTWLARLRYPAIRRSCMGSNLETQEQMGKTHWKASGVKSWRIANSWKLKNQIYSKLAAQPEEELFTWVRGDRITRASWDELTSEHLVPTKDARRKNKWEKKVAAAPNELLDCAVYSMGAMYEANPSFLKPVRGEEEPERRVAETESGESTVVEKIYVNPYRGKTRKPKPSKRHEAVKDYMVGYIRDLLARIEDAEAVPEEPAVEEPPAMEVIVKEPEAPHKPRLVHDADKQEDDEVIVNNGEDNSEEHLMRVFGHRTY